MKYRHKVKIEQKTTKIKGQKRRVAEHGPWEGKYTDEEIASMVDYDYDYLLDTMYYKMERMVAFCQGIQSASPVDSYVAPEPWAMPGYDSQVIMAAGAFIQGSSIELSADGPLHEPYAAYFQGGLTFGHAKFGILKAAQRLYEKGLLVF